MPKSIPIAGAVAIVYYYKTTPNMLKCIIKLTTKEYFDKILRDN